MPKRKRPIQKRTNPKCPPCQVERVVRQPLVRTDGKGKTIIATPVKDGLHFTFIVEQKDNKDKIIYRHQTDIQLSDWAGATVAEILGNYFTVSAVA
jgi:hypothetical protein